MDITVPTNFPAGDRRTRLVLLDRDGDVWREAGRTAAGEPLMVCDSPQAPEDRGDGPSFAWTLRLIEAGFGPVRTLGDAA